MERRIQELRDHIIVCGYGRVGRQVVEYIRQHDLPFVVIEDQQSVLEQLPKDVLRVEGDATVDETLRRAGVERARGIIVTISHDPDNVMIALIAKELNPQIQIIARAERVESEEKIRKAGADRVINPSSICGRRMAMSLIRPSNVEYIDVLLQAKGNRHHFGEVVIHPRSPLVNKTLQESKVRNCYGVMIVGIKRDGQFIGSPAASEVLRANDLVIAFGSDEQLEAFAQIAKGGG